MDITTKPRHSTPNPSTIPPRTPSKNYIVPTSTANPDTMPGNGHHPNIFHPPSTKATTTMTCHHQPADKESTDGTRTEDEEEDMDPEQEYTEEPHATRRREILQKYPEIKKLMGYDPRIGLIVTAQVMTQLFFAWLLQDASWTTIVVLGYFLSPFFNQSLGVAMHEMGHNLAFGHRRGWMNRMLGIWCNLPLVVPMAITFKKYHSDHHRFLGDCVDDVDVPCKLETLFFYHPFTKFMWMVLHPFFYAVRPFYKCPKPPTAWEIANVACQLLFNYAIYAVFGLKSLVYLFLGLFFGLSLHPLSAHYISEHYFLRGGNSTHSYYGPLNLVLFNAGFHNEHHDFPYIPYSRLPEVRRIAPEFYEQLPHHSSWVKVMWDFIFDDQVAPHAKGQGADNINAFENQPVYRKVL